MFHEWVSLATLIGASAVGRSARFFLVAALIYKFGPPVKEFIDRYFNRLMWTFLILVVLGFAAIKYLGGHKPLTHQGVMTALTSPVSGERNLMIGRVREAAGREFGFDPAKAPDDAANQAALALIEEWAKTLPVVEAE